MTITWSEAASRRLPAEPQNASFFALIAVTCILILSPQTFLPVLKPLRLAFVAGGIAGASLLWQRRGSANIFGLSREIVVCFALLAWSFMTVPVSLWPGGSVAKLTDVYIKSVIFFWLLANGIDSERRFRILRLVLIASTVPLAAIALKNYANGDFIEGTDVVTRVIGYDAALTANPNDLALILNLLLPLALSAFLSAKSTFTRALYLSIIVLDVLTIVITFSRAGFLGLAVIIGLYVLRMLRRRGADRAWAVAIVAAAIVALPLVPTTYMDRISTIRNVDADTTGSAQARWRDMVASVQYISEHPILGAGLGMDVLALNQVRGAEWVQVHNVYLEYAVDLGLPGAMLFIALLLAVLTGVRASRKTLYSRAENRELFLIVEALETSVLVFAICGFFYPIAYHFFFYFIGGLALAARTVTRKALLVAA